MYASPVPLDRMLFTMVDPHRGHEVAYNRWYERDHFYGGCMIGPGWFAAQRWAAPRRLKDLRFPTESPVADPVDAGSLLSVYWMTADDPDLSWATQQVRWLYAHGRGFTERTLVHSGIYQYLGTTHRDPDGVPVELAFDHGYPGLGVVVVEPVAGTTRDELRASLDVDAAGLFADDARVDMVASFGVLDTDVARVRDAPPTPPLSAAVSDAPPAPPAPGQPGGVSIGSRGGSDERIVQLAFIEGAPHDTWDAFRDYATAIEQRGRGTVTFAAPFFATVVGTDTYTDELW
jgi:hypothetical protein